jgi:hypothetical protein
VTIGYLDPGSGSIIASAVVGGFAAAGVAVKQARHRFASKFSRKQADPDTTPADAGSDAESDVDAAKTEA